jgi:gamma-glutamyltranspeptidase/glutathione hydrolase
MATVTSPHERASAAGIEVLRAGGNAIESAVAMASVLSVVCPHFCGLGGDAVWVIADAAGNAHCLLGIGQAARACSHAGEPIPVRGPRSAATTACAVDSWGEALDHSRSRWNGHQSFASLLEPAIELAERGFEPSRSQRFWLDFRSAELDFWPGFAPLFDTRRQPASKPFAQPQLAASLREMAAQGPRSFYEGPLARRIADGLLQAGSPITADDLAATRARWAPPLSLQYTGYTLLAPPPPTQGVTTLITMGILERLGIASVEEGSADFFHLAVEAIKQAFLLRGAIADPDHCEQPVDRWLSADNLDRMAAKVDRARAAPWPHRFATGDTVFFAARDAEGRSASVLQSIYFDWGSGVVAGDTGILWQNRAAAFSPQAGSPNAIRPGARPFYTLNPGIALKAGRPGILYGTQGADGQPQTLAILLARIIDHRMDAATALAAPRFLLGRTFSDSRDSLKLEASAGTAVFDELRRRGHELSALPAMSPIAGLAGLIVVEDGTARGAHDPRGEGSAFSL